jgi:hypothetical protein
VSGTQEPSVYRPNVRASYGTAKSVVQRGVQETRLAPKQLAPKLNVSKSRLHQFIGTNEPHEPKFSHVREMVRAGALAPVHDLCALAGGIFMPSKASNESIVVLTAHACTEHAESISKVLLAMADGKWAKDEKSEVLRELDEAIHALVAARVKIEQTETE